MLVANSIMDLCLWLANMFVQLSLLSIFEAVHCRFCVFLYIINMLTLQAYMVYIRSSSNAVDTTCRMQSKTFLYFRLVLNLLKASTT